MTTTVQSETRPEEPRPGPPAALRPGRHRMRWRHKVPTIIQMESVECGAASLAMILGYYGRFVALEELRVLCGVSRDGAKASTLLFAARAYGLIARGFQGEAEVLRKLSAPVIIFWAFQHFMVVEGVRTRYGRTMVAVNDPAAGPRLMDWDEFDSGFTGIVLSFEKGPDFRPGGKQTRVSSALMQRRLPSGRALPLILLASLLLVIPGIMAPAFSRVFIDRILTGGQYNYLLPLAIAMAGTAVAVLVLTTVQRHYLLRLEIRLGLVGSARFFRHLLHLPVDFFMQRRPAEVAKRVSGNDVVAEILSRDLALSVINLVLVVFYAAILIRYDVILGVIGIGMAVLNIVVLRWVSRSRTDAVVALRADRGNLTATTFTTLSLIETVKATGCEPDAFNRWAGFLAKVVTAQQRLGVPTAVLVVVAARPGRVQQRPDLAGRRGTGGRRGDQHRHPGLLPDPAHRAEPSGHPADQPRQPPAGYHRGHQTPLRRGALSGRGLLRRTRPSGDAVRLDGRLELRGVNFGYSPLADPVLVDLSPDRDARPPDRRGRRLRQRQVDGRAACSPVCTRRAIGRDPVRRRARGPDPAHRAR